MTDKTLDPNKPDDPVKQAPWWLQHLFQKRDVVVREPLLVAVIFAVGAFCGWGFNVEKIDVLAQHIELLKDKANNSSTVRRHLSNEEKVRLLDNLKPLASEFKFIPVFYDGSPESGRYAIDFIQIMKKSGIQTLDSLSLGLPESESDHGVLVGVANVENPPEAARKFFNALKSAGLSPAWTYWSLANRVEPFNFDLFITSP